MSHFKPSQWSGMNREAATADEIATFVRTHPEWSLHTGSLEKTYRFANYFETMAFVNAVAWIAHRHDHHPDMAVSYNRLVLRWNTHDVGGISATDMACALAADGALTA